MEEAERGERTAVAASPAVRAAVRGQHGAGRRSKISRPIYLEAKWNNWRVLPLSLISFSPRRPDFGVVRRRRRAERNERGAFSHLSFSRTWPLRSLLVRIVTAVCCASPLLATRLSFVLASLCLRPLHACPGLNGLLNRFFYFSFSFSRGVCIFAAHWLAAAPNHRRLTVACVP